VPNRKPNPVLRYIRTVAATDAAAGLTDRELLDRFAARRDEAAFSALVRRHGPMVFRVCRQVLHNGHDAEDAFQSTFLVLGRQAGGLRPRESVGGWLHSVAYRTAQKARVAAARRVRHEGQAVSRPVADPLTQITVREAHDLLDRELARLPDRFRAPLVLCYLEGLTRDEAARRLDWPAATVKSRLEQARDRLRIRLGARGLSLGAVLTASLIADETAQAAVPTALLGATVAAATSVGAAGVSVDVALLTEGMVNAMSHRSIRILATLIIGLWLAGTATSVVVYRAVADPPASGQRAAAPAAAPREGAERPEADVQGAKNVRVVVLDPQGNPLAGAKVHSSIWTNEKEFKANHDYQTDAAGGVTVDLPKTFYILRLWASKKPFVEMFSHWEQNELASGVAVPAEYTMRLETAVTAGGRVVDEHGKPIAGAKVQVRVANDPKPAHGDSRTRYNTWLAEGEDSATTDAEGRWHIDNVPDHPQLELSLQVSHPDHVPNENWRDSLTAAGITAATLRQETATLSLKSGVIVTGRVTDAAGKPIKDALVIHGDRPYFANLPSKFPTDADGRFRLPALATGATTLTVIAAGWAPQLRKVNLQAGLPPQNFKMAPGKPIRLRVVNGAGKPIAKADVSIVEWRGSESLESMHNPNHPKVPDTKIPRQTKADGVWVWPSAADDPVKLRIWSNGFAPNEVEIGGGAPERTIVLKAEHHVSGRVYDAVTGNPIPAFAVVPVNVFRKDWLSAERGNAKAGKDGQMDFHADRTDNPLRLRVEAPGYRTQTGPEFRVGDDSGRTQDFHLQASPPVVGTVVDAAGRPASGVEMVMGTPTEPADFRGAGGSNNNQTTTDATGRFAFSDPGEPFMVVARTEAGYAQAEFPVDAHGAGTLRLKAWASVRGRFQDGGKPIAGATVFVQPIRIDALDQPRIWAMTQVVTGPDGAFEFPRVPPGAANVRVFLGPWKDEGFRCGPSIPLELKPGERAELDLGRAGATVSGRVKLTGKVPADLDCTYSLNHLVLREPGIAPPPEIAALGFDARGGWRDAWRMSQEGIAYMSTLRHWFVKLAPDGSFRVSGVPPGDYDLAVAVYAKPSGCLLDPIARQVVRVTVTTADVARGEMKVPDIAAAVVPVPAVGDTPALTFRRSDGAVGSLADVRGKYALIHFWASWCGPCKQQLPAVRRLHEQFAARGLVTLGLSVDEDASAWQAAEKRLALPWPQGRLAAAVDADVSGVPTYWLLDPEGKIVAKVYDIDELAKFLAERLTAAAGGANK
jgi:RNA polymerase sigma factor (sigma-70 family)